jgi:hypothetical protein
VRKEATGYGTGMRMGTGIEIESWWRRWRGSEKGNRQRVKGRVMEEGNKGRRKRMGQRRVRGRGKRRKREGK